jgi:hypothetical protein
MSDPTTPPAEPVKPGYKTTEFYLTLAGDIVALLLVSDVIKSESGLKFVALAGAIIGRVLYQISRAKAKAA